MPLLGTQVQDPQCASGARPAFTDLFEMLDAVDDVAFGILVGQV
jgi:hypothetical protein